MVNTIILNSQSLLQWLLLLSLSSQQELYCPLHFSFEGILSDLIMDQNTAELRITYQRKSVKKCEKFQFKS